MLNYNIIKGGKDYLLLLHGFMEDSRIWQQMERYLLPFFTLIEVDLLGPGESENRAEKHTMEDMAIAVYEVIENLNINKINILGHSMGGYVALAFAEKYGDLLESITLFFSSTLADDEEKKKIRERSLSVVDKAFSMFVNNAIPSAFNINKINQLQSEIDFAKKIALSTNIEGVKSAQRGMMCRIDRTDILNFFQKKILIIVGKYDNTMDVVKFINKIPQKDNIRVKLLDCGHNGYLEMPKRCSEIIVNYLK